MPRRILLAAAATLIIVVITEIRSSSSEEGTGSPLLPSPTTFGEGRRGEEKRAVGLSFLPAGRVEIQSPTWIARATALVEHVIYLLSHGTHYY
ncbi:unnamed protein product [Linum trigynum]|uniref:Secreted protein n=1 Tax=Linum trigynum TaxID=586398 RepID=A0AAV2EML2_9ROSI